MLVRGGWWKYVTISPFLTPFLNYGSGVSFVGRLERGPIFAGSWNREVSSSGNFGGRLFFLFVLVTRPCRYLLRRCVTPGYLFIYADLVYLRRMNAVKD